MIKASLPAKRWNNKTIKLLLLLPMLTLAAFLLFTLMLSKGIVNPKEYWSIQLDYFLPLNKTLSSYPVFWDNLTHLGDALILFPLLSFFIIFRPQIWVALFSSIPLGVLLAQGGKRLAEIPRPAAALNDSQFVVVGDVLTSHNSLPSGHTVTVFAAMTVILGILIPYPKKYTHFFWLLIGFGIAATLALSRVAVGAHWPIDIMIGSIFGAFAGISGILITQRYQSSFLSLTKPNKQFILGLIMLAWSFYLLSIIFKSSGNALFVIFLSAFIGLTSASYLISRCFTSSSTNSL